MGSLPLGSRTRTAAEHCTSPPFNLLGDINLIDLAGLDQWPFHHIHPSIGSPLALSPTSPETTTHAATPQGSPLVASPSGCQVNNGQIEAPFDGGCQEDETKVGRLKLKAHRRDKRVPCRMDGCSFIFPFKSEMERHFRHRHSDVMICCPFKLCPRTFKGGRMDNVQRHVGRPGKFKKFHVSSPQISDF